MNKEWYKKIKYYWSHIFVPSTYVLLYKLFYSRRTFRFQGKDYKYFYHEANTTWMNERAIEIPIICSFVKKYKNYEILEIGNVLSHYFMFNHDIVDKYEIAEGVINEDVMDYRPNKSYKLIISISTLEHVGWDEIPKDPKKIFFALENLKNCLSHGGELIVTIPIGQNPILDNYLKTGEVKFTESYYFEKISKDNQWIELKSQEEIKDVILSKNCNLLFLGIYHQ